jgi:hypothetical protein
MSRKRGTKRGGATAQRTKAEPKSVSHVVKPNESVSGARTQSETPQTGRNTKSRGVPWAFFIAGSSIFALLFQSNLLVWLTGDPHGLTRRIAVIAALVTIWLYVLALLLSQLRAMRLDETLQHDDATRGLVETALARTAIGALWGSVLAIVLIANQPSAPDNLVDAIARLTTFGAVGGLATCCIKCIQVCIHSVRELKRRSQRGFAEALIIILIFNTLILLNGIYRVAFAWPS